MNEDVAIEAKQAIASWAYHALTGVELIHHDGLLPVTAAAGK
jgi:hypothetical protein